MHRAFLIAHRWLALVVAVFLVVVAVSGGLLVLEGPVSRARQPHVEPAGSPLPLDTLVQRARAKAGGGDVERMSLGDARDVAWSVALSSTSGRGPGGGTDVLLNPYTGAILTSPPGPDPLVAFMRKVHLLHTQLLGGRMGASIVAGVTFVALFLVISGIIIWWRDKLWRVNTRGSWKRTNFDLHHALGIWAAVVMLIITSSGLWVHYATVDEWMRKLNRSPTLPVPSQPAVEPGMPALSLDSIAAAARAAVPGAAIMNIQLPPGPKRPAMVQLKYPEDHTPAGRSRVFVDKYRGTVLLAMSTRTADAGQHMIDIKRSLHTGDIYGLPTQILWVLGALLLATQAVTGVLMWWNAKRRLV
ncbi:MAG: PepSY-associated TM helix domain-containing protein [Gemmatimonadaceae bacterium]